MQSFCFCLPESSSQFGANCKIRPRISAQKLLSSDEDVSEPVSFLPFVGFPHSGCASCDAEGYIALWVKQKNCVKKMSRSGIERQHTQTLVIPKVL